MNRELALKIVLALVELIFLALAYPLIVFVRQDPVTSMMFSITSRSAFSCSSRSATRWRVAA